MHSYYFHDMLKKRTVNAENPTSGKSPIALFKINRNEEDLLKKKEKQIVLGILIAALFLWWVMYLFRPRDCGIVCIQINGEDYGTYFLSEDQRITINATNVCEIKDGKLTMTASTCPDHLCMKQGAIDNTGGMIVCLPNKIMIEGQRTSASELNDGVDAIAW